MKKILLSSIVLTFFACSIILFQLSCKKSAQAETPVTNPSSAGIVLYDKEGDEIWKVNIDGTGNQKVNIILPVNVNFEIGDGGAYKLTADAKKIVFQAENTSTGKNQLYSCNLDGSSVKLIVEASGYIQLGSVH